MTNKEIINDLRARMNAAVANVPTEQLQVIANELNADTDNGVDTAFFFVLETLESRMTETDFIDFCEGL